MLSAQEKVKEVVSADYNRNSVSYVFVERNQQHAADVNEFYNNLVVEEKFDHNKIATKMLGVNHTDAAATVEDVTAAVTSANLGKEVISFIFNRKEDGTFDDALLLQRGLYDAKDQDIKNAGAAKVKDQSYEWGEKLVNNSYVVVLDIYNTEVKNSEKGTTYLVQANAHAYKLDGSKEVVDNFYATAWADASMAEADKAKAVAAFDAMTFDFAHVATVSVMGTSSTTKLTTGSIYRACQSAYESVVYNLEKAIPAWQVATPVVSIKPIAAKIGKKEGLKNGDRYQAYSYKEDKDGELESVKRGMVRATVISQNDTVATGETEPSFFYQISGAGNIQEGYTLKQKNDLKLGATLSLGALANGSGACFRAGLDFDYIAHIGKKGGITYGLLNVGILPGFASVPVYDASVGVGYGLPISRFFEITPLVMGGTYMLNFGEKFETYGYFAEPAVRLAATFQPLSIGATLGAHAGIFGVDPIAAFVAKFNIKWTF